MAMVHCPQSDHTKEACHLVSIHELGHNLGARHREGDNFMNGNAWDYAMKWYISRDPTSWDMAAPHEWRPAVIDANRNDINRFLRFRFLGFNQ
jgi:hypothetical protein